MRAGIQGNTLQTQNGHWIARLSASVARLERKEFPDFGCRSSTHGSIVSGAALSTSS
jgi:hypothetical protein